MPKFAGCVFILFLFCLGCSVVLLRSVDEKMLLHNILVSNPFGRVIGIDWVRSKPLLGLAALLCPLMATVSAFGLLLWLGCLYNAIVNVSPFICLCGCQWIEIIC